MKCERLHGTLTEAACIARQDKGIYPCKDCDDGKKIKAENPEIKTAPIQRAKPTIPVETKKEEKKVEAQKEYKAIEKTCPKCGQTKPLEEFGNDKNGKYGKRSYCKECDSAYAKENWQKKAAKKATAKPQKLEVKKKTVEEPATAQPTPKPFNLQTVLEDSDKSPLYFQVIKDAFHKPEYFLIYALNRILEERGHA